MANIYHAPPASSTMPIGGVPSHAAGDLRRASTGHASIPKPIAGQKVTEDDEGSYQPLPTDVADSIARHSEAPAAKASGKGEKKKKNKLDIEADDFAPADADDVAEVYGELRELVKRVRDAVKAYKALP